MTKKQKSQDKGQSSRRVDKGIRCDRCGQPTTHGHIKRHQLSKTCQEKMKAFNIKIDEKIKRRENAKRKPFAEHVQAKDELLSLIEHIEDIVIVRGKPSEAAGMLTIKSQLLSSIVIPTFSESTKKRQNTIFLYGSPGTGKTMITRNLLALQTITFFQISPRTQLSSHLEERKRLVNLIFDMAGYYSPSVIFFDDADVIFNQRLTYDNCMLRCQLIANIQRFVRGCENQITVIAATNRPWQIDQSLIACMSKNLHVGLPSTEDRKMILRSKFGKEVDGDFDFNKAADITNGFTASDLDHLIQDVLNLNLRTCVDSAIEEIARSGFSVSQQILENIQKADKTKVNMKHLQVCLQKRVPSEHKFHEEIENWSVQGFKKVEDKHEENCTCVQCAIQKFRTKDCFTGAFKGRGVQIGGGNTHNENER